MARPVAGTVAFVTAVALAGTVLAQDRHDSSVRTTTVHYSDLDLSTTAGAMTLYQRIRGAARMVCGEEGYGPGVDAWLEWKGCFQSAVNDAVEKVHSPLLKTVHQRSAPEAPVAAMLRR
jgi:UrcA family protein